MLTHRFQIVFEQLPEKNLVAFLAQTVRKPGVERLMALDSTAGLPSPLHFSLPPACGQSILTASEHIPVSWLPPSFFYL